MDWVVAFAFVFLLKGEPAGQDIQVSKDTFQTEQACKDAMPGLKAQVEAAVKTFNGKKENQEAQAAVEIAAVECVQPKGR